MNHHKINLMTLIPPLALILTIGWFVSIVHAAPIDDYISAQNTYMRELSKLKNPTPAQISALQQKILVPANEALQQANKQAQEEALKAQVQINKQRIKNDQTQLIQKITQNISKSMPQSLKKNGQDKEVMQDIQKKLQEVETKNSRKRTPAELKADKEQIMKQSKEIEVKLDKQDPNWRKKYLPSPTPRKDHTMKPSAPSAATPESPPETPTEPAPANNSEVTIDRNQIPAEITFPGPTQK